jgi:hypothetical protein
MLLLAGLTLEYVKSINVSEKLSKDQVIGRCYITTALVILKLVFVRYSFF